MKLIVLAAGKGTRFYPLTKDTPKGMIEISGKPLLEHVLHPYLSHVSEIIFVINNETGHKIRDHFKDLYEGHPVSYFVQGIKSPKGTFGALTLVREVVGQEVFCVTNCDDLLLEEDVIAAMSQGVPGIGVTRAVMRWSYLGIDSINGYVSGFRRHNKDEGEFTEDNFSNGFHLLTSEIFSFDPVETKEGEIGLPQTLFANLKRYPLKAFTFNKWQAVNEPEDLKMAQDFLLSV